MTDFPIPKKIPFQDVLDALQNEETALKPVWLRRLSDLEGQELVQFEKSWSKFSEQRKRVLLEKLERLYDTDTLLSFESICRLGAQDADPQVRLAAMHALQEYEVEDMIPAYLTILETEADEELRALAATSLGKYVFLGEIEELPLNRLKEIENGLLKAAGEHERILVRRRAVESLGYSSHKDVPRLIEAAYTAGDTNWLMTALLAMGRSYQKRWHPKVLKMLDHALSEVRYEAIRAAGELELAEARPRLIELLEEEDREARMAAVWSLSQIGGEGLQKIFEKLLDDAEFEEEMDIIAEALDNLIFNDSMGFHDLLDDDFADFRGDEDTDA